MNTCYEDKQENIHDCVEFIDLAIEILLYHGYVHPLFFIKQAEAHYQLGNRIRALFLLKKVLGLKDDPDALILVSKIYFDLGYSEKVEDCRRRYDQYLKEEDK